jgi:hypothetical protein
MVTESYFRITNSGRAALHAGGYYEARLQHYRAHFGLPQIPSASSGFTDDI